MPKIQRFGDVLDGSIRQVSNNIVAKYYISGYLTREQRVVLDDALGKFSDTLAAYIPSDIANVIGEFNDG